jgi:nucleoside-diphosphate-sugar epimerase
MPVHGIAVARVLLAEQHEVTVLDNLSKGFHARAGGARFIEATCRRGAPAGLAAGTTP